jgi:hypothetical protein
MVRVHDVQETKDSQGRQRGEVGKVLRTLRCLMRLPCPLDRRKVTSLNAVWEDHEYIGGV